ncbi:hypothetical protein RGF97_17725 [Streptomyces roseicoloratus]|uniref:Uncharacterized protein n=1 Tax=Streptomyces roseicoloratus TaxID=2508722 RepID=A0ABY9RVW1_9ACTN|nr:hypothetical protein [Streptomyces roseicoloratus]WMX46315.1 hypothetical protein RGF97_17725 [Streptomyces roseicoloratus]
MSVENEQYVLIMERLKADFPDLAAQLDQELKLGRAVSGQKLRREERYERATRLEEAHLPALGKTDVAVVPYSGEERVELIREALLTLAETMYASRQAALKLTTERGMEQEIRFGDPEEENPSFIHLREETDRARVVLETVRDLLFESIDEMQSEGAR